MDREVCRSIATFHRLNKHRRWVLVLSVMLALATVLLVLCAFMRPAISLEGNPALEFSPAPAGTEIALRASAEDEPAYCYFICAGETTLQLNQPEELSAEPAPGADAAYPALVPDVSENVAGYYLAIPAHTELCCTLTASLPPETAASQIFAAVAPTVETARSAAQLQMPVAAAPSALSLPEETPLPSAAPAAPSTPSLPEETPLPSAAPAAPSTLSLPEEAPMLLSVSAADLTDALTKVTYSGLQYNQSTNTHSAELKLMFELGKETIQNDNYRYTYTIPQEVIVPDGLLGGTFNGYDIANNKGFTFTFAKNEDGSYRIDIVFDKDYVDKGGDTFKGWLSFGVSFGEDAYTEDDGIHISFSKDVTLDIPTEEMGYPENETKNYDFTLSKNGAYNAGSGKILYTVTVVSKKGTPGPVKLTDVLTANGLEILDAKVTSVQLQNFTNSWGGLGEKQDLTDYTESFDQTTDTLTMTLPQLTEGSSGLGQKYTITYEVDVSDPGSNVYSPKNTVTGTSEKENGPEITETVEKTVTVKKTPPDKSGSYDAAQGAIDWKIILNQDHGDLTGYILTDPMFADLTEDDIVLTPDSGYEFVTNSDGKIESIKFIATTDGENHQQYTITYSTPQETSWTETTVTNEATYTPPDGSPTKVSATVTYKNTPPTKTGSYDAANGEVDWTMTINAEGANIAGATLEDTMFAGLTGDDIVLSPNSGYEFRTNSDGKIESIKFLATTDGENHQQYTITYSTPQETSWTETTVTNEATYTPPDGPPTEVSATVTCKNTPPTKTGSYDPEKGIITWTITVNQDEVNIVGYELKDTMLKGLTEEEINIQPATGYKVETDEQGKITKIVFTETGKDTGENRNSYTITYTTQQDRVWGTVNVENTVSYGTEDKQTDVTATVPVTGGSVEKTHTTALAGADGSRVITWTTKFTIPSAGLPANSTITDTLVNPGSTHYMTAAQIGALTKALDAAFAGVSYTLQVSSDGENWVDYNKDLTGNFVAYKVGFPSGLNAAGASDREITLTYESTAKPGSGFDPAVYANRVTVATPNGSHSDEDKEEVPGGSLDKQLETAGEPADGKKILTWKTSFTVPGAGLPANSTITDTLVNPGSTHYMTAAQIGALTKALDAAFAGVSYTLQVSSDGENWVDYNEDLTGNYVAYKITLTEGLAADSLGGKKLEFTYGSTADISAVLTAKDYVNKVTVLTPNGDSLEDQDKHTHNSTSKVEKTVESTQQQGDLKEITWKTTLTLESGVLARGMKITDTIQNPGTTHYMTAPQVAALKETLDKVLGTGKYQLTLSSDGQNFAESAENVIAYKITMLGDVTLSGNILTYTYQTTADISAVTSNKTFTNKVEVENPEGDKVTDEASCTHTCRVFKYDGNFKPSESSVSTKDGVLTWKVKVVLDKTYTKVDVKDTLPDGVSLTKLEYSTEQYWINNGGVYTVADGAWSSNNKKATVTVDEQTVTTTFENVSGTLWLTYTCQLGDEQLNQSTTANIGKLTNQVEVTTEEGELGSSEQTQDVTVEKPSEDLKYVDKSAKYSKNNATICYSVVINKDAEDYLPEKDTIHFTDILSYQFEYVNYPMEVTLVPSSVKLYKAVAGEDGSLTKGEKVDFAWTLEETPITSQSCTVTSTLEGDVPDGTALILEYDYFVKVRNGYTVNNQNPINFHVSNIAKLEGEDGRQDDQKNTIIWEEPEAGGSISTEKTYTLYKVAEGDYSKPLDGAIFTLYKYDTEKGSFVPAGKTYKTVNGMIQVSWQNDLDIFQFDENTAYYIVETQAPDGYILPPKPTKYYFYFSDEDLVVNPAAYPSDWDTSPEYSNKADLVKNNRTIYCENTSATTSITVKKAWKNNSGTAIPAPVNSISFDLYQVASNMPAQVGTEPEMVNLTVKGGGYNANPNYGYNNTPVQKGSTLTVVIDYGGDSSDPNPAVTINGTQQPPTATEGKTYTYTLEVSADTEVVAQYNKNDGDATITVTLQGPPKPVTTENKYHEGYTLTAEQDWQTVLTNLPRTGVDQNGATVYYSYYVKETTEGYTVAYSNGENPVVGGDITITNTTDTAGTVLTVEKKWSAADGTSLSAPNYCAVVQLYQKTEGGEDTAYGNSVCLDSSNNWKHSWTNLPAKNDADQPVTYYVVETKVTDENDEDITEKFDVTYSGNNANYDGAIIVTNKLKTLENNYQLPETGGVGNGRYRVVGVLLLAIGVVGAAYARCNSRRKKTRSRS